MKAYPFIRDGAIAILLLILLYQWNCGKNSSGGSSKNDTTIIHVKDSTTVHSVAESGYRPGPIPVSVPVYVTIPPQNGQPARIDTLYEKIDSLSIIKDYFASRYYQDTVHLKYADVVVKNKTSMNRLDSQSVVADFHIPEIHITEEKRKLYLGGAVLGSPISPLKGAELSLGYVNKKKSFFEAGAVKIQGLPLQYKVGFRKLITFRKNK